MEAIIANQIREADKVKTLRKYLAGEAKQKISDHYQDVNVALTALVEYFGNPKLIWMRTREPLQGVGFKPTQSHDYESLNLTP